MKSLIVLASLLFSQFAFAGFAGDWIGWGTWKFKGEGEGVHCNPMTMTWVETTKSVGIQKGYFDCELVAMYLDETIWVLKDGKLFDNEGQEVGTYDGQNFEVMMPSGYRGATVHIKARREANHIDYDEIWFDSEQKIYVIEGRLFTGGK